MKDVLFSIEELKASYGEVFRVIVEQINSLGISKDLVQDVSVHNKNVDGKQCVIVTMTEDIGDMYSFMSGDFKVYIGDVVAVEKACTDEGLGYHKACMVFKKDLLLNIVGD